VAGGGTSTGKWNWPWRRDRKFGRRDFTHGGNEHEMQAQPWINDGNAKPKEGSSSPQDNKMDDKVQGGYPMDPSTDDPARSAFGEENPEAHNTDPFKSK